LFVPLDENEPENIQDLPRELIQFHYRAKVNTRHHQSTFMRVSLFPQALQYSGWLVNWRNIASPTIGL
jgi:hypothetical protein